MLKVIDEMMLSQPKYVRGKCDCEWWVRHLFNLDGIDLDSDVHKASKEFELVKPPYRIMDIAVFRNDGSLVDDRHVGVMINGREFTHFSEQLGIAKVEITRPEYEYRLSHVGRHRKYADQSEQ